MNASAVFARIGALRTRDRRALAWGALLLVPAVLLTQVVGPTLAEQAELKARLERERDLLQREEMLLAGEREYPLRYREAEERLLNTAPSLFPGPDLVAASAALGSYVNGHAYANRVMIQRSEPGSASAEYSGVARLRLDVQGVSDLEGIVNLLHALEGGEKLVSVERLAIASAAMPAAGLASDRVETLAFGATIVGYALADSGATSVDGSQ